MAGEVIAHLATAAALPLTADVLGAPLPHAREIGDEVVDGLRGGMDFETRFTMQAMDGHKHSPGCARGHCLRRQEDIFAIITSGGRVVQRHVAGGCARVSAKGWRGWKGSSCWRRWPRRGACRWFPALPWSPGGW